MKISNIASALLLGSMVILGGCGNDDTNDVSYEYSVKVQNLTAGQPMSPIIVSGESIFSIGESASVALETLAEGGDNSKLLNAKSVSGTKLIKPGESDTVTIQMKETKVSIATMLVKTNDAFAGLDGYDLSALALNDSAVVYLKAYDAGTEANDEINATIPGQGGEGFNAARETSNIITAHSGVVTYDDGLMTSGLSAAQKFDNPVAIVIVTRTK